MPTDPGPWQQTMTVAPYRKVEMWRLRPLDFGGWSVIIGVTSPAPDTNEVMMALDDVEYTQVADDPPVDVRGTFVWRYLG